MEKPVLRFDRTDEADAFVLVQVARNGTRALDVKFIGTEGACPYVLALRQNKVNDLKIKNVPCTDEEWMAVMERLVRQEPQRDIEATATVAEGKALTITIRKRVGDITQRLGALTLDQKEEEIELFDWCGASVQALFKSKDDLVSLNDRVGQLQSTVRELQTQLDDLIEAKSNDEAAWLEKFRDLLNEKKVKIREQQSIIDSTPAPVEHVEEEQEAEPEPEPEPAPKKGRRGAAAKTTKAKSAPAKKTAPERKAGPSRPGKRKTRAAALAVKEESEAEEEEEEEEEDKDVPEDSIEDDAVDQMDVDEAASERETTDDDATASEDDYVDVRPVREVTTSKAKSPSPAPRKAPARSAKAASPQPDKPATGLGPDEVPPPKRALPFGGPKPKAAPAPPPPDGSESESDDEL